VDDAGNRRPATGLDVGGGAGNGTGGRKAAEERGGDIRASPWAISSWLGSWRSSIWLSATRAESSDSMAPSRAMVMAGEISLPKS
jgi:hypothetical protein